VAWIFDGVDGDLIGCTGHSMGGAAGDELDRVDSALGTPEQTVVLARSFGHSDFFQRAIEEVLQGRPGQGGTTDPEVRADMVYVDIPGGGAVFSVGSITWMGSLLTEDTDSSVSRVTENVLRRFASRQAPMLHTT
jgi:N,N-dimethylformamidase